MHRTASPRTGPAQRSSRRATLAAVTATLLTAVGIGMGAAAPAQAATVARASVCFDSPATASGYTMTEAALWWNGSRWLHQATTTLSNTGGCTSWNLDRAGIWAFTVASAYRVNGAMEYHSGASQVLQVRPGSYVDFGRARVTVSYGR